MASPAAAAGEPLTNGISTPPATTGGAPTQSTPPTSTQQANTQVSFTAPSASQPDAFAKKPRDARLIHLLLSKMGVHTYADRVPLQLLDFAYRYTSSILSDAQSYEPPAPTTTGVGKKRKAAGADGEDGGEGVSINALRTAVAARSQGQFNAWLPKEFMSEVASERNRVGLPRVEREFGVRLPPERYCFTGVGWDVRDRWEDAEDVDEEDDEEEVGMDLGMGGEVGFGGPVGGSGEMNGELAPEGDLEMGGMDVEGGEEEGMDMNGEMEDVDQEEFEEAMGN
jgi:transcription initiation factor TFIID subunit 9B